MLRGTIVENSLKNKSILEKVHILKTWQEGSWTVHDVQVDVSTANEFGKYIDVGPWYVHFWDPAQDDVLVVFKEKNFQIKHSDKSTWKDAVEYGLSIGIPKEQLDFKTFSEFYTNVFGELPQRLKQCAAKNSDVDLWRKDYLSKQTNVQKYVFLACEQLQIIGVSYLKYNRDLTRYTSGELATENGNIVARSFEKEARLCLRRASELFIESWNFQLAGDKESILRTYFLIRSLEAFYKRKRNSEKYCNLVRKWDTSVIKEIRDALRDRDLNTFFLNSNRDPQLDTGMRKLRKGYLDMLDDSIPKMTPRERLAVGESYQLYAETSDVIHGFTGNAEFKLENVHREIESIFARIGILSVHILKCLAGIGEKVLDCPEILTALNSLETGDLSEHMKVNVGDLVLVKNEVKARVVEISVSKFGCEKYRVEFCDKRGEFTFSFEETEYVRSDLRKLS